MGRFVDFVLVIAALFMIYVATFAGGAMLNPMADSITDTGIDSKYNADQNFDDMIKAVTVWVPLIASMGLIGIVVVREYRRQRVAALRGGVR